MESAVDILSGTKTDTNMDYLSCLVYHAWLPIDLYCQQCRFPFLEARLSVLSICRSSPD